MASPRGECETGSSSVTVILFDIDGTLLDVRGAGRQAFSRAIKAVFGWDDDLADIQFAGATDLDVLRRICHRHGHVMTRADQDRFFQQLPLDLIATLEDSRNRPMTYAGIPDLLAHLSRQPGVVLGLVTGNAETCARIKLRWAGLDQYFSFGGYGHEFADRSQIAAMALQRASRLIDRTKTMRFRFLIGDTPSDVAAAAAIGAKSVAVATGRHTRAELKTAGAEVVLDDLSDTGDVLRQLGVGG